MNETVGPRTYAPQPQPFLTGSTANRVEASEATEREIDLAVRDILEKAFDRATEVLRTRRGDLDEGARLLLEHERLRQNNSQRSTRSSGRKSWLQVPDDVARLPTTIEIILLALVGVKAEGRFLCPEPDGRVTFPDCIANSGSNFRLKKVLCCH